MKKNLLLIFVLLLGCSLFGLGVGKKDKLLVNTADQQVVTKTYTLDHISPKEVRDALRVYFYESSSSPSKRMITIQIDKKNLAEFEAQLKKLDKRKRNIHFRIFTIIASQDDKITGIKNKDLKKIISELRQVLSFKSFTLDGVSFLVFKEGTSWSRVMLSTKTDSALNLRINRVVVVGDKKGKRNVEIGELSLRNNDVELISTGASIDENGYLVAGVSRIGGNGDSLVLVINAQIN